MVSVTGDKDGLTFFAGFDGSTDTLKRFTRDTLTGTYKLTHTEATLNFSPSVCGMVVIGDYLYVAQDAGATVTVYRYLKTDLSGKTAMTGITIGATGAFINMFTDGTFIYLQENATTTFHKLSISGTIFTDTGTVTVAGTGQGQYYTYMFDGSNQYVINDTSANLNVYKFTARDGTTISSETNVYNSLALSPNSFGAGGNHYIVGMINIDTTRAYIVYHVRTYTESTAIYTGLYMIPITKP